MAGFYSAVDITSDLEIERRQAETDPSKSRPLSIPSNMTGLTLSGGGIRSAAFSLGALQALHAHRALTDFDYLSTVSGGGYIGASMTAAMSRNGGEFPFTTGQADIRDAASVGHLRNYSNFIMPRGRSGFRNLGEALVVSLRGIVANVVMLGPLMLLAALLLAKASETSGRFYDAGLLATLGGLIHPMLGGNVSVVASALVGASLITAFQRRKIEGHPYWPIFVAVVMFSALMIFAALREAPYLVEYAIEVLRAVETAHFGVPLALGAILLFVLFIWAVLKSSDWTLNGDAGSVSLSFANILLWVTLACATLETIPFLMATTRDWVLSDVGYFDGSGWFDQLTTAGVTVMILFAIAVSIMSERLLSIADARSVGRAKKLFSRLALLVASAILPLAFAGLLLRLSVAFEAPGNLKDYALAGGVVLLVLATALKPNSYSLHRFYRDRLEAAFLSRETICADANSLSPSINPVMKLSELDTLLSPYHLLNTALNLQGSENANQRGRQADFFTFSPEFVGSDLTHYALANALKSGLHTRTLDIEAIEPALDLASVVAISGAAASSNMGGNTIKLLSPTLAFLNIRLGYWLSNPRAAKTSLVNLHKRISPKLHLALEMFGLLDENRDQLYLTDGGHIENLGVYQLLKRGCQLIFAVDAEADPSMSFPSFLRMERYARIDLGVRIDLPWEEIAYTTGFTAHALQRRSERAYKGPHCAIGKIFYADNSEGVLVYVKSSMTGDERDYIRDYMRRNPSFPHERTSDQFFTEEQFEVYRALGFHAVDGLLSRSDRIAFKQGSSGFRDIEEVYRRIGELLPNTVLSEVRP